MTSVGSRCGTTSRVLRLPPLQSLHRLPLARGTCDLDQRHARATATGRSARLAGRRRRHGALLGRVLLHPAPRRLRADGLAFGLREVRRVRRLSLSLARLTLGKLEGRLERAHVVVDLCAGVAEAPEPLGDGPQRERLGLHARHLVPLQRRRHPRIRHRTDAVRGGDRPIASVLVVVEEDTVTLFLPPLRRRDVGEAALDLASERERRLPDVGEVPLGADPHVHVDPLLAARLGEAHEAVLLEHVFRGHRHFADVLERHPRHRVEIHAELVRMVDVARSHGPGIDLEASERRRPREVGGVGHHRHVRGPAAREGDERRLDPGRRTLRQPLLIEALPGRPVGEPVERRRPVAAADERGVRDLDPVAHEVELRDRTIGSVGEVRLVGVGHPDVPARYVESLGLRRHASTVPWSL